jgi:FlaA1/EpsC-like NDP-sugar epimerase
MFKINNFSIVPKYVIFLLDLGATVTALFIAILIQQNVSLAVTNWSHVLNATFLMLLVNALVFSATKSYTGIVRYTGVQDALRIAIAVGLSSFIILVINTVALGVSSILSMTTLVIVLYTIFSFLFLISYRVLMWLHSAYLRMMVLLIFK